MSFIERLKMIMERNRLSIKDLSKITGIPYPTLLAYMQGKRQPAMDNLIKLAIHLSVNLNWLIMGYGQMDMSNDFVREETSLYDDHNEILKLICVMLKDMPKEEQREILKHIQEKKLLKELLEKKLREQGA